MSYYLGVMSGTSCDGIDIALVDFSQDKPALVNFDFAPFDENIRQRITALYTPGENEIDLMGELDIALAHYYADAINAFIQKFNLSKSDICAIGNHGQTVRHRPQAKYPFTLQLGCNQTLACLTGIRVVGDFRTKDMALGGQGAPLVPAFHRVFFRENDKDTVILNLGGIANITYLPLDNAKQIVGYDTGPANALLDDWYQQHHSDKAFDENGLFAKQGNLIPEVLDTLLSDPYFATPAPKSSGREYFNLDWLSQCISLNSYSPADIQATLVELTVESILAEINSLTKSANLIPLGGGVHNSYLIDVLKEKAKELNIPLINQDVAISDNMEAMTFAWLAYAYDKKLFSNIPAVTGAREKTVLGTCFFC